MYEEVLGGNAYSEGVYSGQRGAYKKNSLPLPVFSVKHRNQLHLSQCLLDVK